jgi:DNA-directed RNA polymerase N-terminal
VRAEREAVDLFKYLKLIFVITDTVAVIMMRPSGQLLMRKALAGEVRARLVRPCPVNLTLRGHQRSLSMRRQSSDSSYASVPPAVVRAVPFSCQVCSMSTARSTSSSSTLGNSSTSGHAAQQTAGSASMAMARTLEHSVEHYADTSRLISERQAELQKQWPRAPEQWALSPGAFGIQQQQQQQQVQQQQVQRPEPPPLIAPLQPQHALDAMDEITRKHALLREQFEIEERTVQEAAEKYKTLVETMARQGRAGSMKPMQRELAGWFEPLCKAIDAEQGKVWANVSGKGRLLYGPLLVLLQPDKLAVMVIHETVNMCLKCGNAGVPTGPLCLHLADAIQAEVNVLKLQKKFGGQAHVMLRGSARRHVREVRYNCCFVMWSMLVYNSVCFDGKAVYSVQIVASTV